MITPYLQARMGLLKMQFPVYFSRASIVQNKAFVPVSTNTRCLHPLLHYLYILHCTNNTIILIPESTNALL